MKLVCGFSFETTQNNEQIPANFIFKTRMHSSRMRTGRSLIVCRSLLPSGVCSRGGVCSLGGGIPACTEADTPPVNRMTDTSKNITLATTSLRPVEMKKSLEICHSRKVRSLQASVFPQEGGVPCEHHQ